jgi:serine/threonine protein kinase
MGPLCISWRSRSPYDCTVVQADDQHVRASTLLTGLDLDGGWRVVERIARVPGATGSSFSTPYLVERIDDNGKVSVAFLKALDFTAAMDMPMPIADALQLLTNAYVFERNLVLKCAEHRMGNVIGGIAAGQVRITDPKVNPLLAEVPYLILERADRGDVRTQLAANIGAVDEAWVYRVCHGASNGLRQLHQAGISHQDVKPSNVMSVGSSTKLGDLGRASTRDGSGIFDGALFAGDVSYAPPECLYREPVSDHWNRVRESDMYQLGSLLVFLLIGSGMTSLLHRRLPPTFHWSKWPDDYENVLPYVRDAFDEVCAEFETVLPTTRRADVLRLVRVLCDPNPSIRGWPTVGGSSRRLSMERCVSYFDRLARLAEMDMQRAIEQ